MSKYLKYLQIKQTCIFYDWHINATYVFGITIVLKVSSIINFTWTSIGVFLSTFLVAYLSFIIINGLIMKSIYCNKNQTPILNQNQKQRLIETTDNYISKFNSKNKYTIEGFKQYIKEMSIEEKFFTYCYIVELALKANENEQSKLFEKLRTIHKTLCFVA